MGSPTLPVIRDTPTSDKRHTNQSYETHRHTSRHSGIKLKVKHNYLSDTELNIQTKMLQTELFFLATTSLSLASSSSSCSGVWCRPGRECVQGTCVCLSSCPQHWKPKEILPEKQMSNMLQITFQYPITLLRGRWEFSCLH